MTRIALAARRGRLRSESRHDLGRLSADTSTSAGLPFDYVLYTNYERQVEALFAGHIHVAWNSPLAWLQCGADRRGTGTPCGSDLHARHGSRSDVDRRRPRRRSGIASVADLKGRRVAVGAADSPQATLIPLCFLAQHGLEPHQGFHGRRVRSAARQTRRSHRRRAGSRASADARRVRCGLPDRRESLLFVQEGTLPSGATTRSRADAGLRSLQLHGAGRRAGGAK